MQPLSKRGQQHHQQRDGVLAASSPASQRVHTIPSITKSSHIDKSESESNPKQQSQASESESEQATKPSIHREEDVSARGGQNAWGASICRI